MARTSALVEIEVSIVVQLSRQKSKLFIMNSESLAANDFDNTSDRSTKNAQSNGEDTVGENTPDNFRILFQEIILRQAGSIILFYTV